MSFTTIEIYRNNLKHLLSSVMSAAPVEKKKELLSPGQILAKAGQRAFEGGVSGATSMVVSVFALMWMRTTINYQYRHGTSMMTAFKTLYAEGGVPRFYRGLLPALVQGPLSRFGDTAANAGTLTALDASELTANLPVSVKTVAASVAAALFRIVLMPVDTVKTSMQVGGKDGFKNLVAKIKVGGPAVFWYGSLASASATFVGHYPWFFVYNYLSEVLPKYDDKLQKLGRQAVIGFAATAISDTCSNSIRVIKVYKQANTEVISYPTALKRVLAEDGFVGLFGRGLSTKLASNGLQGVLFAVCWKYFDELFFKKK